MATVNWTNTLGGDFDVPADWSTLTTVPGSTDLANLDALTTAYTVTSTGAVTVDGIEIATGNTLVVADSTNFTATAGTDGGVNAGTIDVNNNSDLSITAATTTTLDNTGVIALQSSNNTTELGLGGNTTLTGVGGQVTMSDNSANYISGAATTTTLTNVNNTISGSGQLGDASLTLVNDAAGVVDATGTSSALVLDTSGSVVTNKGKLEATGGGGITVAGLTITSTTVNNTGTIFAATASAVNLSAADIAGGTLTTTGTGVIETAPNDRASTIDGSTSTVTNAGYLYISNNAFLTIQGAVDNTGTISEQSVGNTTELIVGAPGLTLSGAGQVTLTDNAENTIIGAAASATLTNVNNTISGAGQLGDGQMTLINDAAGIVDATGTNNALFLDTTGETVTNKGKLEATGAAGLTINSTTVNSSGTTPPG